MEESSQVVTQAISDGVVTFNPAVKRYTCTVCEVALSGGTDVAKHLEGSKHREAGARYAVSKPSEAPQSLKSLLTPTVLEAAVGGMVIVTPKKVYECRICSVQLSGLVPLKSHLVSDVHNKKVELQRLTGSTALKFAPTPGSSSGAQDPQITQSPPIFRATAATEEIPGFHAPSDVQGFSVAQTPTAVPGVSLIQTPTRLQDVSLVPSLSAIQSSSDFRTSLPAPGNSGFIAPTPAAPRFQITDEEIKTYAAVFGTDPPSGRFAAPSNQQQPPQDESELEKAFREMLVIQTDNTAEPFSCIACQKRFNSSYTLSDHLKSKKHKKKEIELDLQMRKQKEKEDPPVSQMEVNRGKSRRKYSVASVPRGHVYVFNNTFDGQGKIQRTGAKFDSLNIYDTFRKMGYDVFILEDLTKAQTLEVFKNIRGNARLSGVDALIIFILSHGVDPYTFKANDGQEICLHKIRFSFTNRGCPYMKGKPKIFFTNYCRGEQMEKREVDSLEVPCDMVTIHAAIEGVMAHRLKSSGTVFVKCLCEVLNKHARNMELRELYGELGDQMRQNRGTRPMWEDYGFEKFCFSPV